MARWDGVPVRRKTMCNNHHQGTAPLPSRPFIKITAFQRLRRFSSIDIYLHKILPLVSRWFSVSKGMQSCLAMLLHLFTHSFTRYGCQKQAPCYRVCGPRRHDPPSQSSQADGHSGYRTCKSNQRDECDCRAVQGVMEGGTGCWPHWGVRETSLPNWHVPWEQEDDRNCW